MNRLIKYFNEKYEKEYGKIAYPRTTLQIYRTYQAIKSYGINDEKLVELLHNIKLPRPKTIEEKELYTDCLYNKDDSEITSKGYLVAKDIENKVDKVNGKGLSTVDFTKSYETKLKGLENYDDTDIKKDIQTINSQFKDIAKQTITTDERTKLNSLENYDDTEIKKEINGKASKNEIFTMANMGQDIKEAMTGGSVAVIGEKSVNIVNLHDDIKNDLYVSKEILTDEVVINVIAGKKSYFNPTYKLMGFSNSIKGNCCKIFKLLKGNKYKLCGNGMAGDQTPIAVICTNLTTDVDETIKYIDAIEGSSSVSILYEEHDYIATQDCYIYLNGSNPIVYKYGEEFESIVSQNKNNIDTILKNEGVLIENNLKKITHFTRSKDNIYICRVFKHCFINNLLQLESMYLGNFNNGTLTEVSKIGTSSSDVIGPISIHRGDADNWAGTWSGGSHGITIDGAECPTAKEISLKIYCNNEEITKDGYYYGHSKIKAINDLYFPKTITGSDLSTATKAIKETRVYNLINNMEVDIKLEFYSNVYVTMYYGCQCNTYNMTEVIFPNNEVKTNIKGLSNQVDWSAKENKYFCTKDNMHYDVELKPYGLGTWKYNTSEQCGYLATFSKIYFILMQNQAGIVKNFNSTKVLSWGAIYDFYID